MHSPEVRDAALALIAAGHNDCEVARRTGLPRTTVRDWRRLSDGRRVPAAICPRCWRDAKPMQFTPRDYSQLLGVYLGDGCISEGPRTCRLRIALDASYPRMNAEIKELLERCFPSNAVSINTPSRSSWSGRNDTWSVLSLYSLHLPCLLPQHGPGRKHERPIVLKSWQAEAVATAPWGFIRGCIQTDGCAFINRTDVHRAEPYEYRSYQFFNRSKQIADLFVTACELVSVRPRITGSHDRGWSVRINRRPCVALMLDHVGLKS